MKFKTFLMHGYTVPGTMPGLFAPVLDRHGKPAKLRVLGPRQAAMVRLIQAKEAAKRSAKEGTS